MASRWIRAATEKENTPIHGKGSLRNIGKLRHREPDADERGGPSDRDADDAKSTPKKKKGFIEQLNEPVGY